MDRTADVGEEGIGNSCGRIALRAPASTHLWSFFPTTLVVLRYMEIQVTYI
jgi:hypothetical protein